MGTITTMVGTAAVSVLMKELISFTVAAAANAAKDFREEVFEEELESFERKLLHIRVLLDDAEAKQVQSPAITNWLSKLKDAAYDAQHMLDDYAVKAELLQQRKGHVRKEIKKKVKQVSLLKEIRPLNKKFENIIKEMESLGLKKFEMPNKGKSDDIRGCHRDTETNDA